MTAYDITVWFAIGFLFGAFIIAAIGLVLEKKFEHETMIKIMTVVSKNTDMNQADLRKLIVDIYKK